MLPRNIISLLYILARGLHGPRLGRQMRDDFSSGPGRQMRGDFSNVPGRDAKKEDKKYCASIRDDKSIVLSLLLLLLLLLVKAFSHLHPVCSFQNSDLFIP